MNEIINKNKNIFDKDFDFLGLELKTPKEYAIASFLFSLVFPFISWILDISINNIELSFHSILEMHLNNPLHFFIYFLMFLFSFFVFIFIKHKQEKELLLEKKILEKNQNIQKNSHLAKMIGEKDFSISSNEVSEDDELGNALLLMRENLKEASKKDEARSWIASGKENIANILRLHNNISKLAYETLVNLIKYIDAIQGSFYLFDDEKNKIINIATFAYNRKRFINQEYSIGEGLIGQTAYEMDTIYRREIPENYVTITSGILGDKKPSTLLIVPLISDEKLQGILEFASLNDDIPKLTIKFIEELSEIIAQTVFNLKVNIRTEKLLKDAQEMTEELQENEEELRQNAEEMRSTQEELEKSNQDLEGQIAEVERSQKRLHSLLENASEVISIYEPDGILKYVSPSVSSILGYNPKDAIGKNGFQKYGNVKSIVNYIGKKEFELLVKTKEKTKTYEFQYKKSKEKELIWLETSARNLIDNPAIGGILFNTRDITVRKVAERAQRMSGQMQALSENSHDMIIRIGLEGVFFYANPMVKTFTGVDIKNIIKKNLDEVEINKKYIKFFKESLEKIKVTKEGITEEISLPTHSGEIITQVNAIPEVGENGELETILFVAHDITERKNFELEIEKKNRNITESINYAYRIQTAILPDNKLITEFFPNSFILYKPRDIVSGDFPWFFQQENQKDLSYIAAVDCTGHGVPGALLSFIGYFLLNNIVDHNDVDMSASEILDKLHRNVRTTLKQDKDGANARDGMDIAFCKIDKKKKEIQYSGAHRPLYFLRDGKLKQYKGTPKAIGGIPSRRRPEKDFINYKINYEKGDKIFFFSDGLPDQIGGASGRKYQAKRIRAAIVEHQNFTMYKFLKYFAQDFNRWKGEYKQIDDVLLMGIEF